MAAPAGAHGQDVRQGGPGATGEGALAIDVSGKTEVVQRSDVLTFGRAAELVVGEDNPYLHRVVGRFFWRGDWWWLENLGTFVQLEVVTDGGATSLLTARGPEGKPVLMALTDPRFRVLFESGGFSYEVTGTVDVTATPSRPFPVTNTGVPPGAGPVTPGAITLAADERNLLLLLAEPRLRDPAAGPTDLPADWVLSERLGWPVTKVNSKLDYLGSRFCKAGVRGLQGPRGELTLNRRWRLAGHAIEAGLVTPADLET